MKRSIWIIAALVGLLGGCATTQLDTPTGFASHDESKTYDFRASDGEGVVIAVRTEKNRPSGDLLYWSSTIDVQLRKSGYEPLDRIDVKSADGHAGKQLRYVLHEGGREMVYWLSVFVTDARVIVVEAGGDAAFFEPKASQVEAAIGSLSVG
ncbi:hypothetical protein [Enhygromyxa salina]|uniref:Lipoprotein n=1 Tax=Enhygromyxa salina TaxID=215803 RepID=A0A2S9Y0G4_9BACT|nr:hypothetical protein [Enhygromyxa salina]PRP98593.1 hypothetical protein ENSA7_65360 [Enhygromyxa salina]